MKKYYIKTLEQFFDTYKLLKLDSGLVSIDTETTGLNPRKDKIIMIQLANANGGIAFDVFDSDYELMGPVLRAFFDYVYKTRETIFHNGKFDIYFLWKLTQFLKKNSFHDTKILSKMLNSTRYNQQLQSLCVEYLGVVPWKNAVRAELENDSINNCEIDKRVLASYGINDAYYTNELFKYLWNELLTPRNRRLMYIYQMELRIIPMLIEMEHTGIEIDKEYFQKARLEFKDQVKEMKIRLDTITNGKEINFNSPAQLANFLYVDLKIPVIRKTPTGNPSTDAETLSMLNHPIAELIGEYRFINNKVLGTYLTDDVFSLIENNRLKIELNQSGAVTGRFSSRFHNIPRKTGTVRKSFKCSKGKVQVFFDYEQIEMMLFAHHSEEKIMIDAIKNKKDLHAITTRAVLEKENIMEEERKIIGKRTNFGVIYGIGAPGLSVKLHIQRRKAQEFLDNYYKKYPQVKRYMESIKDLVKHTGCVYTWSGRRTKVDRSLAYKGVNYIVQGGAADIIKVSMGRLYNHEQTNPPNVDYELQIHDELFTEINYDGLLLSRIRAVKTIMENFPQFRVPIRVDVKASMTNWEEKIPILEFCKIHSLDVSELEVKNDNKFRD